MLIGVVREESELFNIYIIYYYIYISVFFLVVGSTLNLKLINNVIKYIIYYVISLINVIVIIFIYSSETGLYFDYQMADTLFYYNTISSVESIESLIELINSHPQLNLDDYGVALYTYYLLNIYDSPLTIYLSNVFLLSLSTHVFYLIIKKLSDNILDNNAINIVIVIHLFSTYLLYFSAAHFKEIIFYLLTLISIYSMIRYNQKGGLVNAIGMLSVVILLIYFRLGVPILFIFSYITANLLHSNKFKYAYLIIALPIVYIVISISNTFYFNYFSIDYFYYYIDASGMGYNYYAFAFFSLLSSILGPFPTISAIAGAEIQNIYSFGYYLKIISLPLCVIGIYSVFKQSNNILSFKTLIIYYLLSSFLFGIILRGFDIRFTLNSNFVIYIFLAFGISSIKKYQYKYLYIYLLISVFIITIFDYRLW